MRTKIIKLPNGGTIIYKRNRKMHQTIVNVGFLVRKIEKKDYGVAHFLEHMLFKGTTNKNLQEFLEAKSEICPSLSAYTSVRNLCVVFKRTNKMIEPAFDLASDMILNAKLDKEDIEKERNVILKELKITTDKRETLVSIANRETMADNSSFLSYTQTKVLGDEKIINSITRKKLLQMREKLFLQNNFVCSITTSLSKRKILKLITERLYNKLPFIPNTIYEKQLNIANKKSCVRVVSHTRENKFSYMLTFVLDKPSDETRKDWNYNFATNILRRHIMRELREKGLTYTSYISSSKASEQFFLSIRIETTKEDFENSLKVVCGNIKDLKTNFVAQEEIDYIRANFIYAEDEGEPRSFTSHNEGRLYAILDYGKFYPSSRKEVLKGINSCTKESIKDCYNNIFSAQKLYMTILGQDIEAKDYPTLKQLKNKILN